MNASERAEVDRAIEAALLAGDRPALAVILAEFARRVAVPRVRSLPAGLDIDDVIQEATIKALAGLARWDPSRGVPARVWVWRSIRQSIMDSARSHSRWARRHRPMPAGI